MEQFSAPHENPHHAFTLLLATAAALVLLLSGLIVVALTALATRSGEIAFESNQTGNWDIFLLDLQTGTTRNLTRSLTDEFTPAWSPDGTRIAFVSDRDQDLRTELYVMDADGSNERQLSDGAYIDRDPYWTVDGRLVYMHGWKQAFMMDVDSGTQQWIGNGFMPRLSPDESALLYYIEANNSYETHVYTIDMHDHRITDLTSGASHNWGGVWSPDGSTIAFMSNRGGKPNIFTVRPDGSRLMPITSGANDFSPAWSPDGTQIVYASSDTFGRLQLTIVDADGGNLRVITSGKRDSRAPAWRP